jgi:Domain of Unknown Function (DUF1259)
VQFDHKCKVTAGLIRDFPVHERDDVEQAIGKPGSIQPDGVYKIGLPRTDLHVKVGDVEVKPTLALGSWVAFQKRVAETIAMGDLVLTEDEVAPVMAQLQEGHIEITALHNHLLNENPRVMYMHISGHGDAVKLAQANSRCARAQQDAADGGHASPAARAN